ncbi:MAG: hypothetical protein D084_Lepto4C00677G0001, partial [Leptospirillum sp. Group IV 'UBA BS']
ILSNLFALRVPPTPGGVSLMQNLSNQVQERWANPQWLVDLHTLSIRRRSDGRSR